LRPVLWLRGPDRPRQRGASDAAAARRERALPRLTGRVTRRRRAGPGLGAPTLRASARSSLPDDGLTGAVPSLGARAESVFDRGALDLHRRREEAVLDEPGLLDDGDELQVLVRVERRVHLGADLRELLVEGGLR